MGASQQWADSQPRERARPMHQRPPGPAFEVEPLTPAESAANQARARAQISANGPLLRARLIESEQLKPASPERLARLQETYREQQRERSAGARSGT
jgi:hypothetical protein